MTTTLTASQIYTAAREMADMDQPGTGPAFVDDTEIVERVNEAVGALWDLLVAEGAEELLVAVQPQVDVTNPTWPPDMLRLIAIHATERGGTRFWPLERIDVREWHTFDFESGPPEYYSAADMWDAGADVPVLPAPVTTTYDYQIRYVPEPSTVDEGTDEVELPNRWHTWLKHEVAIHLLAKEESDPNFLVAKQAKVEQAILKAAARQDLHRTRKVRRVRGRGDRHNPRDGRFRGMP